MHIIGTAGHVDHGKSSLVIALTGHDPDRFIEERERGMTLDLGFAPLRFDDGIEAGIIDVPGHERFLHNMLAGAAGMELLLLVIGATDGPKPQTFEHLHILNFLNVQRALIVLTKIDLVEPSDVEIAAALARDACRGTIAQDAPVIPVSTLTGEGIEALKAAIHEALASLPSRSCDAPAFLPVDRVFALQGHGTIVTGTLMQGTIRVGDALALQPSGLAARVKSLQTFGIKKESVSGGSRVAVNIPGIDVAQIARGETLVAAREFEPAKRLSIAFTPVRSALPLLKRRIPIRAHIGSAEITGTLRFTDAVPRDVATSSAELSLNRPAVFYPGIRLILRRMSPKDLLGGAVVHSATQSAPDGFTDRTEPDETPAVARQVLALLEHTGLQPLALEKIASQTNVVVSRVADALSWLVEHGRIVALQKPKEYCARRACDAALQQVEALLQEHHASAPHSVGLQSAAIARRLGVPETLALRLLAAWQEDGRVDARASYWHLPHFSATLNQRIKAFFEDALAVDHKAPFLPHSFQDVAKAALADAKETREALESLLIVGAVVKIGDDLYRKSQIERAQQTIRQTIAQHGPATMAQLRDALGTSRKYALPLMEYLDSIGFTIRDGDLRRVRAKA